jgi:carbamoyl-phosphate synthase large subunit
VRTGVPCVTTVAGLAAAVQGIERLVDGEVGVRSLQEHARRLRGDAMMGRSAPPGTTGDPADREPPDADEATMERVDMTREAP